MFLSRTLVIKFTIHCLCLAVFLLGSVVSCMAGFLYVLNDSNAGSNVYGFSVNESTGALTLLPGFPVAAGLGGNGSVVSERMTVDAANRRLYVLNDTSETVSAWSIDPATGALTPMPFSPIPLATETWNTLVVHPSGSPLIVSDGSSGGGAHSFNITSTTATAAVGSPFLPGATTAFSSTFSRDGMYFYVGGNTGTVIAGFSVNTSNGVLTALPGSPFPAGATSNIAYAMDTAGRLFAVDTLDAIRIFTSTDGVLSPVTGNPFISGLTQRRFGLIHPNQNFYIVAGNTGNNVGVFQISGSGADTTVAPVPGSPFATGATTANCLAITNSGNFLYVGNRISRSVTTFSVNTSTGVLSSLGSQASNTLGTVGAINGCGYLPDVVAVNAQIGGRVTDAGGNGVGKVIVQLTSMDGMTNLIARTNPFGYYNFPAVLTGSSYTLTPSRKVHNFTPPSITFKLTGDVTNQDFTAEQD
jgi:6-phosphogluconolactonase (cycloisomerase 2 family)